MRRQPCKTDWIIVSDNTAAWPHLPVKLAKWTLPVTGGKHNRPRMPIPPLDADGHLPPGVHDASLAEIRRRFGRFQRTDRRVRLQAALEAFVAEARVSGLVGTVIVNGSFTTGEEKPGDVDIIIVLRTELELARSVQCGVGP